MHAGGAERGPGRMKEERVERRGEIGGRESRVGFAGEGGQSARGSVPAQRVAVQPLGPVLTPHGVVPGHGEDLLWRGRHDEVPRVGRCGNAHCLREPGLSPPTSLRVAPSLCATALRVAPSSLSYRPTRIASFVLQVLADCVPQRLLRALRAIVSVGLRVPRFVVQWNALTRGMFVPGAYPVPPQERGLRRGGDAGPPPPYSPTRSLRPVRYGATRVVVLRMHSTERAVRYGRC
eukprot:2403270-Rhodomonas_salina.1